MATNNQKRSNKRYTFNTHPSQSHTHSNTNSSSYNQQIRSRKRRFEAYNDNIHYSNTNNNNQHTHTYNNSQPPSKRIRYNQNAINNTNHTIPQFRQEKNRNMNNSKHKKQAIEMEENFHRITQRMRQIDIGKATPEYKNYILLVPKNERKYNDPKTPNARHKMPNKWWKKSITEWRKELHKFDDNKINKLSISNSPKNDKQNMKNKNILQNFCCEKCSKEFDKFDEWQNHRKICDGKQYKNNIKNENNEIKNKIVINENKISDINDDNNNDNNNNSDNNSDSDIENEIKDTNSDFDEESKLLMSLNDILDNDDIGLF